MQGKRISAIEAISFAGRSILNHLRLFFFVLLAGSGIIAVVIALVGVINKSFIQILLNAPIFQQFQECIGHKCSMLVYQSSSDIIQLLAGNALPLFISFIILSFVFVALDLGFKKIALDIHDRDESKVKKLVSKWRFAFKGLCAWFLYCVVVWIGFMLFVIPGFFLLLRLGFFPFFIIDKYTGVIESLKRSYHATEGHFWDIFACWIVIKIVTYICFLSWIGIVLTWPVSTLAYAYVYRQMVPQRRDQ